MDVKAQEYLAANGWDLEAAVTEFFAEQDEALQDPGRSAGNESAPSGGRSLGGGSSESPAMNVQPASSSQNAAPKKRIATLGDYASGSGGAGSGDADSSEEDDNPNQDFFAGGEKSGLAVQNPDDVKKKIIEKAKRYGTCGCASFRSALTGPQDSTSGFGRPYTQTIPLHRPGAYPRRR